MFSIVIPLYNKAHTIVNTLQTVLQQKYTEFEVVIVNDGSSDNGVQIIQEHFSDNRIRIVNQANQGVSVARNRGVTEAVHEWIAFLDADDELLPTYLTKMKEAIAQFPNAGMICCAGIVRNADGSELIRYSKRFNNNIVSINFFENPYFFSNSSSTVIRKSDFYKTSGFPAGMKINEDLVFFCSLALITQVVYCPEPLSIYVRGVEGQATSMHKNIYRYVIDRTNMVFDFWWNNGKPNKLFLVFTKYELRNEIIIYLRQHNHNAVVYLKEHLDKRLLACFSSLEQFLFFTPLVHPLTKLWIYLTKIIWKSKGYPVMQYKPVSNSVK